MNKKKLSRGECYRKKISWIKRSVVMVISSGFVFLGLVVISWSLCGIWTQTHYSKQVSIPPKETLGIKKIVKQDISNELLPTDKVIYSVYPVEGDNIGSLIIPVLNRKLNILQGTGDKELSKGVGHLTQSVLPGEKDNCVISGHRETSFRQLNKLKVGSPIIVQTSAGTFTYEVIGTRIVHKADKTVIVPTENAILTMTTCYPFYFIGDAPDRYIVSAVLVKRE